MLYGKLMPALSRWCREFRNAVADACVRIGTGFGKTVNLSIAHDGGMSQPIVIWEVWMLCRYSAHPVRVQCCSLQ